MKDLTIILKAEEYAVSWEDWSKLQHGSLRYTIYPKTGGVIYLDLKRLRGIVDPCFFAYNANTNLIETRLLK